MFTIIACVGKNNELGINGQLVFHIKEDMKFFKEKTLGHSILMGSKTFRSLPGILKDRKNFVATSHPELLPEGVFPVTNLDEFIREHLDSDEEIFVIGGESIYKKLLPYSKTIYLTEVEASAEADVFFPEFDKSEYNKEVIKRGTCDDLNFTFAKYIKNN